MKYPEKMLSEGESIVFDTHHHPVVLWRPFTLVFLYLALWIAGLATWSFLSRRWALLAGGAVLLALLVFLAWRIQIWLHVNLVLTDRRLIYRSGVLSRQSREVPLSKINDVSTVQKVLERLYAFGDLIIETAGESGPTTYVNLPHPDQLKLEILSHIPTQKPDASGDSRTSIAREVVQAMRRDQPTREITALPPERSPLYSEIVDQIERLDQLKERGVLTPEEFQKAKQKLLGRLGKEPEA